MNLSDTIKLSDEDRILLERRAVAIRQAVGPQLARDSEWRTFLDHLTDRMVIELRSFVYGDRIEEVRKDCTFTTPANWWQALRERVLDERGRLDRAILRRWPIKTRTETQTLVVERWATFPDNETVYPRSLGQVVYTQEARW